MYRSTLAVAASLLAPCALAQDAQLQRIGGLGSASVEISACDATTRRVFTVNGADLCSGIVAVAIQDATPQYNGRPEPEAITIGDVGDRRHAFIGLERIGGAFVHDISNLRARMRLGYSLSQAGDISPEGVFAPEPVGGRFGIALLALMLMALGTVALRRVGN